MSNIFQRIAILLAFLMFQKAHSVSNSSQSATPLKDLYVLALFGKEGWFRSAEAFNIAVEMALERINHHSDILPGYRLNVIWNDTEVQIALRVFRDL